MQLDALTLPLNVADKGFKAGIAAAAAGAAALVGAMGLAIKATFDWANDIDRLGDVMGGTNEEMAALNYIARKSGVGIDTLAKGAVILEKGLVKANGELDTTGKVLKEFGIEVLDVNGAVKDQSALMEEIANKYATLGTQQEKVNFLTEVFGKSGAEMIDFFDTLAAEGGIDAVTEKVKKFGLAISPDRYEKFNRTLEELKLIGLGLAVAFTESVMPIFEKLVDWVMNEGVPAFLEFKQGLINAFQSGGIVEALSFIDQAIATWLDSLDWVGWGTRFGELIDQALGLGISEVSLPQFAVSLGEGIKQFLIAAVGEENLAVFKAHFVDYLLLQMDLFNASLIQKAKSGMDVFWTTNRDGLEKIKAVFNAWSAATQGTIGAWGLLANASFTGWISKNVSSFTGWAANVQNIMRMWSATLLASMTATLATLTANIDQKLAAIAEKFQSRAGAWVRKAADAFASQKDALIGVVQQLVDEINAILKKIITSFTLRIKWGGSVEGGETPKPKPGGACFVAGTLVTLADRTQTPIESIRAGDLILSWHDGRFIPARVAETIQHAADDAPILVEINDRVFATPDHLIYANGSWIAAGDLLTGDMILIDGEPVMVSSVEVLPGLVPTYNLHTDHESHNFLANGLLVHNNKSESDVIPTTGDVTPAGQLASSKPTVMIGNWNDFDYSRLATEMVKALNNQ